MNTSRLAVDEIRRTLSGTLSLPSRIGHTLLLVASLTMAVVLGSLWATETGLPMRTRVAFGVMIGVALAWTAFATWVLARRRVLFGRDRVIAATLACAVCSIGVAGLIALGYRGMGRAAYLGALGEGALGVAALILRARAKRRLARLTQRRRELEAELAGP